jgi:hypothetical protein
MENSDFKQLCVWEATLVGEEKIAEFEKFFLDDYGARIKYVTEVKTKPSEGAFGGTGNRNDVFFYIHTEDISKFAIPRLGLGIRWWEDVLNNGGAVLYPHEILEKYPKTW